MDILGVAHQKRQDINFHMVRENGQTGILFLQFLSPAIVTIDNKDIRVDENACIIYPPGTRHDYRACDDTYKNDYITVEVNDADFLTRFGLPENEIFYIKNGDEITHILEWIAWAVADKTEPHGQDIVDAVANLFSSLARLRIGESSSFTRLMATKQRFVALRDQMRKDPTGWDVEKMAKQVWLTRSRFSVLYNQFFNISPNADLIKIKIEHAKRLLITTNEPISVVAKMCGHSSVEHFIRVFSKTVGKTPLQYRKEQ